MAAPYGYLARGGIVPAHSLDEAFDAASEHRTAAYQRGLQWIRISTGAPHELQQPLTIEIANG